MRMLASLMILTTGLLIAIWLLARFGLLAGLAPSIAVLSIVAKFALISIQIRKPKSRFKKELPEESYQELIEKLDETGKIDIQRLIELEWAFNDLVDNKISQQFIAAEIPNAFQVLKSETVVIIEKRNQYRQQLSKTDVLELRSELEKTRLAMAKEDNTQFQSKLITKDQTLKQQLANLKRINVNLEKLDEDINSSLNSLHQTVILLSEPITEDYDNRLMKQADKLKREVEISQEINTELSRYNSG